MRMVRADEEGELVAAEVLRAGGVAVVPTDTVYGLAARPEDVDAVRAIYRVKGRPEGMHLPVLAASVAQVRALGVTFTPGADPWPGAGGPDLDARVRLRSRARPTGLAGGPDGGGGAYPRPRLPAGAPERTGALVVTSANPHGAPTPRTAHDVSTGLGPSVDLVVDGGPLEDVPSTLVNVRAADPVVEREGAIPLMSYRRRWRRPGDPVPAGHRDVVRRDGGCRGRRLALGAPSVVASQIDLHADFGGVVPELASRAHLETVTPIVERALARGGARRR